MPVVFRPRGEVPTSGEVVGRGRGAEARSPSPMAAAFSLLRRSANQAACRCGMTCRLAARDDVTEFCVKSSSGMPPHPTVFRQAASAASTTRRPRPGTRHEAIRRTERHVIFDPLDVPATVATGGISPSLGSRISTKGLSGQRPSCVRRILDPTPGSPAPAMSMLAETMLAGRRQGRWRRPRGPVVEG